MISKCEHLCKSRSFGGLLVWIIQLCVIKMPSRDICNDLIEANNAAYQSDFKRAVYKQIPANFNELKQCWKKEQGQIQVIAAKGGSTITESWGSLGFS